MTADDRDAEFLDWLRACDEALASGVPLPPPPDHAGGAEPAPWHNDLACLELLDRLRPPISDPAPQRDALPATPVAPPGPVIGGRYRLLERLGSGGMGEVYLAEHTVMRHRVALKVLPSARAAGSAVELFHREARAVASLNHPNIVRALEMDRDGEINYLVMEYVEGRTLHDLVAESGPLDPGTAARYAAQVAAALQHAHERGLIHRDIKPANLIVDATGAVKVLDFGLARFALEVESAAGGDASERVLGTADFMAPEQGLDSHEADTRADVYSLGCTLYFLLAGRVPFPERTVAQKLICHQLRSPESLRALRPGVPDGLAAVVERMMAKNPADRYQLPAEVMQALRPWSGIDAPGRRVGRRRLLAGFAAAIGLAAFAAWAGRRQTSQAEELLESVSAKLRERNPGFDGKLGDVPYISYKNIAALATVRVEGERVVQISFLTDAVTDISPVRDLPDLEVLICRGSGRDGTGRPKGRLIDLSPLRGLPLKELDVSYNPVADLEPLRGMQLERFSIGNTEVSNIEPLRGMPLREFLAGWTPVADLRPLAGAPLEAVSIRNTKVNDLEPLRGAPLKILWCERSGVTDLGPLAATPLERLNCQETDVRSLEPVAGLPLKEINFDYDPARDAGLAELLGKVPRINGFSGAEFWVRVGAQNKAKRGEK